MKRMGLLVLMLLVTGQNAMGYRMYENGDLDRATESDTPNLILAVQIKEVKLPAELAFEGPILDRVVFRVDAVILGDAKLAGSDLDLDARIFMWPEQLVPLKKGTSCIFIIRPVDKESPDMCRFVSVVPAHAKKFEAVKDAAAARRVLAAEILAELKDEKVAGRQWCLMNQASPIINAKESAAMEPFLASRNEWVRRAALAGLLHATGDAKHVKMAGEDIVQFFKAAKLGMDNRVKDIVAGFEYAPEDLLVKTYFFLDSRRCHDDEKTAAPYLPMIRILAASPDVPEYYRWTCGMAMLCRVGDRTDAAAIYAFCANLSRKGNPGVFAESNNRQVFLQGLSRIVGLKLPDAADKDYTAKMASQHKDVTDALIREGLIKLQDSHVHSDDDKP